MATTTTTTTTTAKPATAPATPPPTAADYGYVHSFLVAHPDVAAKVALAVKQRWSSGRLEAEIKTTKWWTSRSDAQRKWDLLTTENPQEVHAQVVAKMAALATQASQMGVTLSHANAYKYAVQFLSNNSSDAEIQAVLGGTFKISPTLTGQAGTAVDTLRQQAGDMGVTLTQPDLQKYTQQMLAGQIDQNGFIDVMREQAKSLYAPIAGALDRGVTVRQYLSPYLSIAGKELGVDPTTVDLTDPKWTRAIHSQTSQGTPMTVDEWTKTLRTDNAYGWDTTTNAKQQAAQLTSQFGAMFGGFQ